MKNYDLGLEVKEAKGKKYLLLDGSAWPRKNKKNILVNSKNFSFDHGADIYVVNTCSVTEQADKKCRNIVRKALSFNPEAFIIVIGCYAQLKPKEIANIQGVDLILGANEKFNISKYLKDLVKKETTIIKNGQP